MKPPNNPNPQKEKKNCKKLKTDIKTQKIKTHPGHKNDQIRTSLIDAMIDLSTTTHESAKLPKITTHS